eukprot:Rmarinus@m.12205
MNTSAKVVGDDHVKTKERENWRKNRLVDKSDVTSTKPNTFDRDSRPAHSRHLKGPTRSSPEHPRVLQGSFDSPSIAEHQRQLLLVRFLDMYCSNLGLNAQSAKRVLGNQLVDLGVLRDKYLDDAYVWRKIRDIIPQDTTGQIQKNFWDTISRRRIVSKPADVSRYQTDYEELEPIGSGGFGEVWKVRYLHDSQTYALKKVLLTDDSSGVEREVRALSFMQHRHIVRYYEAWIEKTTDFIRASSAGDEFGMSATSLKSKTKKKRTRPRRAKSNTLMSVLQRSSVLDSDGSDVTDPDWISGSIVKRNSLTDCSFIMFGDDKGSFSSEESSSSSSSSSPSSAASLSSQGRKPKMQRGKRTSAAVANYDANDSVDGSPAPAFHKADSERDTRNKMMYIKMEYCPNGTLYEVIRRRTGLFRDADIWRIFRQIVEGLAFVHSNNFLHRDLKPSNIFFAENGDIKLGDFGLSTYGAVQDEHRDSQALPFPVASSRGEQTVGVGTSFYIAPELLPNETGAVQPYDNKVDIYSLGVILFEMSCPFRTYMERSDSLTRLRTTGAFPDGFEESHPLGAQVIRWLVQKDPAARPTALEILHSRLLPPKEEEEYIEDIVRTISNPRSSTTYARVVEAVFKSKRDRLVDIQGLISQHKNPVYEDSTFVYPSVLENVTDVVTSRLRAFGAVPTCSLSIFPKVPSPSCDTPENAFEIMDEKSNLFELRHDLRRGFVKQFLRNSYVHNMRRYETGPVYRSIGGKKEPAVFHQCDFDLVTRFSYADGKDGASSYPDGTADDEIGYELELLSVQVELIRVLCDVLGELDPAMKIEIKINHTDIVHGLWEHFKFSTGEGKGVWRFIAKNYKLPWSEVRRKMGTDLSITLNERQSNDLRALVLSKDRTDHQHLEDIDQFLPANMNGHVHLVDSDEENDRHSDSSDSSDEASLHSVSAFSERGARRRLRRPSKNLTRGNKGKKTPSTPPTPTYAATTEDDDPPPLSLRGPSTSSLPSSDLRSVKGQVSDGVRSKSLIADTSRGKPLTVDTGRGRGPSKGSNTPSGPKTESKSALAKKPLQSTPTRHLAALLHFLAELGVSVVVTVDAFLLPPEAYFRGFFFVAVGHHGVAKDRDKAPKLAVGGRYDSLLEDCGRGVGFSIALDSFLETYKKRRLAERDVNSRCAEEGSGELHVVVCSAGPGEGPEAQQKTLYIERLRILGELWNAGFKAGMLHEYTRTLQEQQHYAQSVGASWVVVVNKKLMEVADSGSKRGHVKIKGLKRKYEVETSREDLPRVLGELHPQRTR